MVVLVNVDHHSDDQVSENWASITRPFLASVSPRSARVPKLPAT